MRTKPRVWLGRNWEGGHRLAVIEDIYPPTSGKQKIRVCTGFQWQEYDEGSLLDHFSGISQADELIQAIVDKAWEEGFRPSGFADVKNETAAIKSHLDDMRTVAFHKLGIQK
jgi:hypothetical protein